MFTDITIKVPMVSGAAITPEVRAEELGEVPAPPSVGELEGIAEGAEVLPPPEEPEEMAQYEVPAPPALEELEEPTEGEVIAPPSVEELEEMAEGTELLPPPEEPEETAEHEIPAAPPEEVVEEELPAPPAPDDESEETTGKQVTTPRIKRPKKDTDA